jgi:predicted amidophosphoribosyltransferase
MTRMKTTTPKSIALLKSVNRYPGLELLHHAAYYHAARVGYQDIISRSLHDFKDGCEPQTSRWVSLAAPLVSKELQFDVIVRALGSAEDAASGTTPLDKLCAAIAVASGAAYVPERLQKVAQVRALTSLPGRAARQKELRGAYTFDATGLPANVRILVVDDLATTGATLEAITNAIRDAHAGANVVCFTLARVEAQMHNTHLDPGYFLNGIAARPDARSKADESTARIPSSDLIAMRPKITAASRETSIGSLTSRPKNAPPATGKHETSRPGDSRRGIPHVPAAPPSKGLDTRVYVVGLLLSLLLLGATVLFPAKKDAGAVAPQFVKLVAENAIQSPVPIPERRIGSATEGKTGMVTVPSTGLRSSHSVESTIIPKTTIRNRERVEIIRKFRSPVGPDWVQVRTRSGVTGWVMASVVKEVRG